MKRLLHRLFRKPTLVPYNYGQPDCPALAIGDKMLGVLDNDIHDFIAGSCGMNMTTKAGYKTKWRVKQVYPEGDALIMSGRNRALTKYMKWDDGNRVTVPITLAHSRMLIRFFKIVRT